MKILLNATLQTDQVERIRRTAGEAEVVAAVEKDEVAKHLSEAEVLLTYGVRLDSELMEKTQRLRWVHAMTTGIDKFLTFKLPEKDVILTSSKGIHANQMTEHVFGFMISFMRHFPFYFAQQQNAGWKKREMGTLAGKTLGIMGLGSIGQELARRAKVFDMKVIGTKKNPEPLAFVDEVLAAVDFRLLIPRVDFLVLLVPYTEETHQLIGRGELSLMKKDAYLINVSRGDVVDQKALIEVLEEKIIAGAGLDVTIPEPLPPDSKLWALDNVLITPHVGGVEPDYTDRVIDIFCKNLEQYRRGETPSLNLVDLKRGY